VTRPAPKVNYVRLGEISVAYQAVGNGPVDLVCVPGFVSHLELCWQDPAMAWFLGRLSDVGRLILFDKRGTGLSDPVSDLPGAESRIQDIDGVLDALEVRRAALFGISEGGSLCAYYAYRNPERVSRMVLYSAYARLLHAPDYEWGWTPERYEKFVNDQYGWEKANPSVLGDLHYREWMERYLRSAASPGMIRHLMRMNAEVDIRDLLPAIDIPTLVLARRRDPLIDIQHSRYLAEHIPGARLVELEGRDHAAWLGDANAVLTEVENFLTGRVSVHRPRRGTVLDTLTRREREVLDLAFEGLSTRDIAQRLTISERTVESHISNGYAKLGIHNRVDLLRRGRELGLGAESSGVEPPFSPYG
jgi:pimeloyl-ACP methyl ester carboxylesterase/DNA-binding CsgD family transcriptional regulator